MYCLPMTTDPTPSFPSNRRLDMKRQAARASLLWERLWRGLWPGATVLGIFLGVAMTGVFSTWSPWTHALALMAVLAGVGGLGWWGLRTLRPPSAREADRLLEQASDATHRPLGALSDRSATAVDDPLSEALWHAHLSRQTQVVAGLRPRWPAPGVAALDPLGLRAGAVLALFIGIMASGDQASSRLADALWPDVGPIFPPVTHVQAWITPPEYTGKAPLTLEGKTSTPETTALFEAPEDSKVQVLVHGGSAPDLTFDEAATSMERLGDGSYRAETVLHRSGRLAVRDGGEAAGWEFTVRPDAPPSIAFARSPGPVGAGELDIALSAVDDYGVTSVQAVITLAGEESVEPLTLTLVPEETRPGPRPARLSTTVRQDLTAHAWAGKAVEMRLIAKDYKGQTGDSESLTLRLPERTFLHPVAQAIALQRTRLIEEPWRTREVLINLSNIAEATDTYSEDRVAFLALKVAVTRLERAPGSDAVFCNVLDLLWGAAVRVDGGNLAQSAQALADAQKALEDALSRDAPADEIAQRIADLEQALNQYMSELQQQMERRGAALDELPAALSVLKMDDMGGLLDQLRAMTEVGAKDAARQLLRRLASNLETLRRGSALGPKIPQELKLAAEMLAELQRLTDAQQKLQEHSFALAREAEDYNFRAPEHEARRKKDAHADRDTQETLRRDLGKLMARIGEATDTVPDNLAKAELAMRDAAHLLDRVWLAEASTVQGEILDRLRKGTKEAGEQLAKTLSGAIMTPGGKSPGPGMARDPLGRPVNVSDDGSTKLPGAGGVTKSRKILDELRRRESDPSRPKEEREYLRRLLEKF